MAKRKKQRAEKPPITEEYNAVIIRDTGIHQACSWTAKGNPLDVLNKLLRASAKEHSLEGRRERLQRIVNTGDTLARAKSAAARSPTPRPIAIRPGQRFDSIQASSKQGPMGLIKTDRKTELRC